MKTLVALMLLAGALLGLAEGPSVTALASLSPGRPFTVAASNSPTSPKPVATPDAETATANEVLSRLAHKYRYLDGVTVRMGTTPNDEQAVAYYTVDEIVISPTHTATIEEILAHEVWHIIDWRDNGRLDWGENLPPADSSGYLSPT